MTYNKEGKSLGLREFNRKKKIEDAEPKKIRRIFGAH